jgi:hypothetical protein
VGAVLLEQDEHWQLGSAPPSGVTQEVL